MPLPFLIALGIAVGIGAALAGEVELRLSPRPPLLTASYSAFFSFLVLVLIPVAAYFYVFHGDWFLLYLVDVGRIPSAIALVALAMVGGFGTLGFLLGSVLVRAQHRTAAFASLVVALAAGGSVIPLALDRLGRVGSYAQYHGAFGLSAYGETPLAKGAAAMGLVLLVGVAFLLSRLRAAYK